jgi:aminoglycoside phosphotransferase
MRQAPTQIANVIVTAKLPTGERVARHWQGRSVANIIRAARKRYGAKRIDTGVVWYTN